jgi:hypothetical protein
VELYFSSLKRQVMAAFEKGELAGAIPADHIFKTKEQALKAMDERYRSLADPLPKGQPDFCET